MSELENSPIVWHVQKNSLNDHTIILPSIAVGNVGQLAIDLLINNLETKLIASIHHSCFVPIICPDPYDVNNLNLTTSCQLYECKEKKIIFIQNRSPIVNGRVSQYQELLINFIKEHKIKKTVMLSSSFAQFFTPDYLSHIPLHFLCSSEYQDVLSALSWKPFSLPQSVMKVEDDVVPGGGMAHGFYQDCVKEGLSVVVLILVCSEGDNYPEAFEMVSNLNQWMQLLEKNVADALVKPHSWDLPFGNAPPAGIF